MDQISTSVEAEAPVDASAQEAALQSTQAEELVATEQQVVEGEQKEEVKVEESQIEQQKEQEKFAQKFAALSRKEKAIREREKALEKRIKELEAKQPEVETTIKSAKEEAEQLKRRMKSEPLKVMEEMGLSFQQLADMVLNDGKPTPEMIMSEKEKAIQARIDALEAQLKQKAEMEEQQKLDAAIEGFKSQIKSEIENNPTFELIRTEGAYDIVYDVIAAHHEATGEILETTKAAEAVESHLLEEAKKYLGLNKIKEMLQPPPQQPPAKAEVKPASKTLTNASAAKATPSASRKLSQEESMLEAAKLIKWTE